MAAASRQPSTDSLLNAVEEEPPPTPEKKEVKSPDLYSTEKDRSYQLHPVELSRGPTGKG